MAHTDTWEQFIAKLDNSAMGKKHAGFCVAMGRVIKNIEAANQMAAGVIDTEQLD